MPDGAPDGAPHQRVRPTPTRPYRIAILTASGARGFNSLRAAAERQGRALIAASDAEQFAASDADFALVDTAEGLQVPGKPSFGIVNAVTNEFWEDDEWLGRLAGFDGYLTVSEAVRRFLRSFYSRAGAEPCIGFFAESPARQLIDCRIEKLVELGALRLCHIGNASDQHAPLIETLSNYPYVRLYNGDQDETLGEAAGRNGKLAVKGEPPTRLFAAFGAGLITLSGQSIDAAALYRLCEIVAVGAAAVCPDTPWIRRLFRDNVWYYPIGDTVAAAQAVAEAVEGFARDPAGAGARARAARAVFEQTLAAEVMLQNAVDLFEQWKARGSEPDREAAPESGTLVDTTPSAIGKLFARLPDAALEKVARAVAVLNPLRPEPGWRFGAFTDSRNLGVHVRHSLWLAAKEGSGAVPVVLPWHEGTRLKLVLGNDLSRTLFAGGSVEPNQFAVLDRVLRPGMVFLDGGANEGVYTVFAAARVGAAGRVIAVEPSPRELARLKANISLNRLRNVEIVEAALSDGPGQASLKIAEDEHSGQNTLGDFAYDNIASERSQEVAAITLDGLIAERALKQLDILKLDLEGAELRALSAAGRLLGEFKPLILAEVSDPALQHQGGSAATLLRLLADSGYVLLSFDERTGLPIPQRQIGLSQVGDNIVAVHRDRDWGLLEEDRSHIFLGSERGSSLSAYGSAAAANGTRPAVSERQQAVAFRERLPGGVS